MREMRRVKEKKGVKYDGKRKLRDLKVWIRKERRLKMEKILNDYARKESSLNNDRQEEESNPERSFEGKRRERGKNLESIPRSFDQFPSR